MLLFQNQILITRNNITTPVPLLDDEMIWPKCNSNILYFLLDFRSVSKFL